MRRRNERRKQQAAQDETLDGLRRYMRHLDTRTLAQVIEQGKLDQATATMRQEAQIAADIVATRHARRCGTRTG